MAASEPLHQNKPAVKCGRLNMFSGAVLGMETDAVETDAKSKAASAAKRMAKDFHDADKARACPAGCANEGGGGDAQPQANDQLQFSVKDDDRGIFVGIAESHWHRTRECAGNPQQEALTLAQPLVRELTYNASVEPACGKRTLYAGGVIAYAKESDQADAKKRARESAVARANQLVQAYQAKHCPASCKPETIVGSAVTLDDAKTILTKRIAQATGQPYVSYAVVYWSVVVSCPPEDAGEDDEGEEAGGEHFRGDRRTGRAPPAKSPRRS
jgi:hypothetical protein